MTDRPKPLRVLIADDDAALREMVKIMFHHRDEVEVVSEAADGLEAIMRYEECTPDVVVMDVSMPSCNGEEAIRRILKLHPDARILAHTGHTGPDEVTGMIVAGAVGYIVKSGNADALADAILEAYDHPGYVDPAATPGLSKSVLELARSEQAKRAEIEQLHQQLKESYEDTVRALAAALRSKDTETQSHVDRVTRWSVAVGERLGLSGRELADVEYGATFHDIGKIGVPDEILHNTDKLSDDEWKVIKQHTLWGERIIKPVGFLSNVAKIVRHSHEHWDGSGYPDQLVGPEIPLASRIIFTCDAFDAMLSERSYQKAMELRQAMDRLQELSGVHFDPKVVDALIAVVKASPLRDVLDQDQ